ncbi:MAG: hypothetical protein HRU09_20805 [Oligoflexales bacterium]|nr:hypothetical protein [Oligoflexales bacterium]
MVISVLLKNTLNCFEIHWLQIITLKQRYSMMVLMLFAFQTDFLIGQELQNNKKQKSFDFFSFNPFAVIAGGSPTNMVESIPLQVPDPYKKPNTYWNPKLEETEKNYCGIKISADKVDYQLETFASEKELFAAGFAITHKASCGTCSSIQDLRVYIDRPNLTSPVRKCGALSFKWPVLRCLRGLGFSQPCAETWYYNIVQTRKKCSKVCLKSWWRNENFNQEDGSLNACLACDESEFGPAFKVTAGRTRRRSGIESAIKRKAQEFFKLSQDYLDSFEGKN